VPILDQAMFDRAMREIVLPTVKAMKDDGVPFKGVLYAGLMLTAEGPKLIEYNVRFGDPECQPLMMRLQSDIVPALVATRDGILNRVDLRWYDRSAICVVMAANGYPDDPQRGTEIRGLDAAGRDPDVKIFHAGTKRQPAPADAGGDRILADGGRVLGITAIGPDLATARDRAYRAVDVIDWPGGFCRRDIGSRAIE
jgi:phosphoribosylamine--glycine ligase